MRPPSESTTHTLTVFAERTDASDVDSPDGESLFIDEEIQQVTDDEHDEIYRVLSNFNVDLDAPVPIYDIAWQHIIYSRGDGLLECTLFYTRLDAAVDRLAPDQIVCDRGVSRGHAAVVADVGESRGIPVTVSRPLPSLLDRIRRIAVSSILVLPFLLDQLLALLLRPLVNPSLESDTIFVPALLRLDSTLPVLERAPFDFDVAVASMASSWFWTARHSALDSFDPTPVSCLTSVGRIWRQVSIFTTVVLKVLIYDTFESELRELVSAELGIELNRTIQHALVKSFRTRMFTSMFLYPLFDDAFGSGQFQRVVIGSLSPAGRAIVVAAIDNDVDAFHVPHSIATGYAPNPQPSLTQFASGPLEVEYYSGSKQVKHLWNLVVTGRPYLTELHDDVASRNEPRSGGSGPIRILVPTQPINHRKTFVRHVLDAVRRAPYDAEVVIKVHPAESIDEYAEFADGTDSVGVTDSDLFDLIDRSDVTLTINSNVGLESIIVGTPCICVNEWTPLLLTPPYARACDDLPVLRSVDDVRRFFADLDRSQLESMREAQRSFVHESYVLDGDAVENIVACLTASRE